MVKVLLVLVLLDRMVLELEFEIELVVFGDVLVVFEGELDGFGLEDDPELVDVRENDKLKLPVPVSDVILI